LTCRPGLPWICGNCARPEVKPEMTQGICGQNIKMGVTTDGHTLIYDRTFFLRRPGVYPVSAQNYRR